MKFRTEISVRKSEQPITHQSRLLLIGSCFSDEVGAKLCDSGFNVTVNPTGTLYNPMSIFNALMRFIDNDPQYIPAILEHDGLWHSMDHHTRFSSRDVDVLRKNILVAQAAGFSSVREASHLFVTFGSAYVYVMKETGCIVANCHKLHPSNFIRRKLSMNEIVEYWSRLLEKLHDINPMAKIIFTISPIRHVSDGLHGNQLSKATLLLAVDELCDRYPEIASYFPAYEALMDDLRDYRFYADDLVHPSNAAVTYVYSLLADIYFSDQTRRVCSDCEKAARRSKHRQIGGI